MARSGNNYKKRTSAESVTDLEPHAKKRNSSVGGLKKPRQDQKLTRQEKQSLVQRNTKPGQTSLLGFYGLVKSGRPEKEKEMRLETAQTADLCYTPPSVAKKKKPQVNWKTPENFEILKDSILFHINKVNGEDALDGVPNTTLKRNVKIFQDIAKQRNMDVRDITLEMYSSSSVDGVRVGSLLSSAQRKQIQSIIISRDEKNAGMTRHEVIEFISELTQSSIEKSEQHWKYLVKNNLMPVLKSNGKMVQTQTTTLN